MWTELWGALRAAGLRDECVGDARWTIFGQGVWGGEKPWGKKIIGFFLGGNHHFLAIIISFWIWIFVVDSCKRTMKKTWAWDTAFCSFSQSSWKSWTYHGKNYPKIIQNYPRKLIILEIQPFSELSMMKWEVFGLASRIFEVGFPDFWGWLPGFLGLASWIFAKSFPGFWMD